MDYSDSYNLIDTSFTSSNNSFINSEDIVVSINGLGTYAFPNKISSNMIDGSITTLFKGYDYGNNAQHFSISFGQDIKLSNFTFNINGYDYKGDSIYKSIYIIDDSSVSGYNNDRIRSYKRVYYGNDIDDINISLDNVLVSGIYLLFDDISDGDSLELNYFQVNKYQNIKHQYWTKDYISNTNSYSNKICLNPGEFIKDGTDGVYVKQANTSLFVDSSIISDYRPYISKQRVVYDYLKESSIKAYSKPNIGYIDPYSYMIDDFIYDGLSFHSKYYGNNDYIPINDSSGLRYRVDPVYWSPYYEYHSLLHTSYDQNWCYGATGLRVNSCFKYYGHSSNSRFNTYDVYISTYSNVVGEDLRYFNNGLYYLVDEFNNERLLVDTSDHYFNYTFKDTGIYRIRGFLFDKVGNSVEIESKPFYIDNLKPDISFSNTNSNWVNYSQVVSVNSYDKHSGVDIVKYRINNDNYQLYDSSITLSKEGVYTLESVVSDRVGNDNYIRSVEYKIDKTKPIVDLDIDLKDQLVEILVSDHLSKVKEYYYQVSIDNGESFSEISDKFYSDSVIVDISEYDSPIIIRVVAEDNAGNIRVYDSELINVNSNMASIDKMFSYIYDIGVTNELLLEIDCDGCYDDKLYDMSVYIDDLLYSDSIISLSKGVNIISVDYLSDLSSSVIDVELCYDGELINSGTLDVYSRSYRYLNGSDKLVFKDPIASYIEKGHSMDIYYEEFIIDINSINEEYFVGEGIDLSFDIEYYNECLVFEDFVCVGGNSLEDYSIDSVFDNGALPIRDNYYSNNSYIIDMEIVGDMLVLPNVYVDLYTGMVYSNYSSDLIDGYRRWYLDKDLELGVYDIDILGSDIGVNKFRFDYIIEYIVSESLDQQYHIRFINPRDPYLMDNSLWKDSSWFDMLF